MHTDFMAFVADEKAADVVRAAATKRGLPSDVVRAGGLALLGDALEAEAPPKLLLLDLDDQTDAIAAATRASNLCGPDCRIIFIGSQNDVALFRHLLQLGAADYLVKPLNEAGLLQAMRGGSKPALAATPEKAEARHSKIALVIGMRGGLGATTLTVNLAWAMAHKLDLKVGLLDLDMQFGTTALALDREPGRGMRAALENPERLDGLLIASSMVQESEKLSILCAEEALENPLLFDGDSTLALIRPVRGDFDIMMVDLPRHHVPMQKRMLAEADHIILVCDLTLSSLRDARRMRQFLKNLRPDILPIIVANRMGDATYAAIDTATFEKNLEATIDFRLPEDIKAAKQAANLGKAIVDVAPESPLAASIMGLARMLVGRAPEAKTASGIGGFIKGLVKRQPTLKPATQS
jgi:pilus assembly protein CpaE